MEIDKIYHGDSYKILKTFPENSIDVTITDPDYGVGINYNSKITSKKIKRKTFNELEFDIIPILKECHRVTKRDMCIFWSGSWKRIHDFFHLIDQAKLEIKHMGIWYKPNGAGPTGNGLGRRFEVWFWINGKQKRCSEWRFSPDVIMADRITQRSKEGVLHPSQKPIDLMGRLLRFFTNENDIVLDPFVGSGSTAIVCKMYNRHYVGIDLNKEYVEMTMNRICNVPIRLDEFIAL